MKKKTGNVHSFIDSVFIYIYMYRLIIVAVLIGFIQADKINLPSTTTTRNESSTLPSFNKRFESTDQFRTSGALKRDKRFILFDGGGIVKVNIKIDFYLRHTYAYIRINLFALFRLYWAFWHQLKLGTRWIGEQWIWAIIFKPNMRRYHRLSIRGNASVGR